MQTNKNIIREKHIVTQMIELHCHAKHNQTTLCEECRELLNYAHKRLDQCRYGEKKGACNRCQTHCYKPHMRTKITEVMRYSGKRMILHSPLAALWHLWKVIKPL